MRSSNTVLVLQIGDAEIYSPFRRGKSGVDD